MTSGVVSGGDAARKRHPMSSVEQRTIRRISWRLLPLIIAIYFIAYIDRTNVAFAAIGMNQALGFTPYIYGWGAGMFFIGYFFFEVPSNVILQRVGARIWIARIMATWGLVSALMVFVSGPVSFFVIRFLLGVAEAGFFPGTILYFTYWFPARYRARVISALFLAVPGSNAVAAALSGAILQLDGLWGLAGWQWVFLLESLPAILLAPVVLLVLTDRPAKATWLAADERQWLEAELEAERQTIARTGHLSLWKGLTDGRVLGLSLVYLTIVTATYGVTFFLPLIVKAHGLSNVATGFATAVPYTVGAIGMLFWAHSSDRQNERRWHFIAAALLAAAGLVASGATSQLPLALAAMSFATIGLYGSKPAFWPVPSTFLGGTAAAGGIALMNSIGNLGGFAGPYVVGWIRDATKSYTAGLNFLAACALASAVLAYFIVSPGRAAVKPKPQLEPAP
jgi:MFS transporter, ACS family, tartrate transporter